MSFPDYRDLAQVLSYRATAHRHGQRTARISRQACAAAPATPWARWTPFVTGGIAWASTRYSRTDLTTGNEDANPSNIRLGYVLGGGVDYRLDPRWTARAEYLYTSLGLDRLRLRLGAGALRFAVRPASLPRRPELQVRRGRRQDRRKGRTTAAPAPGRSTARRPSSTRAIRPSARSTAGPTACRRRPEPRDLDGLGLPRRAPVAGRRALLQSRAAAGLRRRQHRRRRRLSQRRGAEVQLPLPALQHLAPVPAPGDRAGRRAREGRERVRPARRARRTSRASRCRSANFP